MENIPSSACLNRLSAHGIMQTKISRHNPAIIVKICQLYLSRYEEMQNEQSYLIWLETLPPDIKAYCLSKGFAYCSLTHNFQCYVSKIVWASMSDHLSACYRNGALSEQDYKAMLSYVEATLMYR